MNREELQQEYESTSSALKGLFREIEANIWDKSLENQGDVLENVKNLLRREIGLKSELIKLKNQELEHADQDQKTHLSELDKKWRASEDWLIVAFGSHYSPFELDWSGNKEGWENEIIGFKRNMPLKNKVFFSAMQNFCLLMEEEFKRN